MSEHISEAQVIGKLAARIARQESEIERLREALRPFAEYGRLNGNHYPQGGIIGLICEEGSANISNGDCWRAAEVIGLVSPDDTDPAQKPGQ